MVKKNLGDVGNIRIFEIWEDQTVFFANPRLASKIAVFCLTGVCLLQHKNQAFEVTSLTIKASSVVVMRRVTACMTSLLTMLDGFLKGLGENPAQQSCFCTYECLQNGAVIIKRRTRSDIIFHASLKSLGKKQCDDLPKNR